MEQSINEQLRIPKARVGETLYAPSMYGALPLGGRAGNAEMISGGVYRNADGDCSGITANTPLKGVVACVNGRAVYVPAIWASLKLTKKGKEKIEFNRCVCQKRKEAKKADDVIPLGGGVVDDRSLEDTTTTLINANGTTTTKKGMSTGMKIGIGIGVLAVVGLVIFIIKRKK